MTKPTPPQIKMSPFTTDFAQYKDGMLDATRDWPAGTFLQGGDKGLVIKRSGGAYTTCFVEAFTPEHLPVSAFFRGEGESLADAEAQAWEKYQTAVNCPGHEFEAGVYTNGGGHCKHCRLFQSKVFTGEDLGQFCVSCGVGTTYSNSTNSEGGTDWYCENHAEAGRKVRWHALRALEADGELSETERLELMGIRFLLHVDENDEPEEE